MTSRSVRFVRNAGWNILAQVALAGLSFFLIPPIIRGLGNEGYALYSLMGALSSYLLLLTFGSGPGTLKFVSEFAASGRLKELKSVLGVSLWLHGGLVALGAAAGLASTAFLVDTVFQVSAARRAEALTVFGCALGSAAFAGLSQFGVSALQGLQRFDLSNLVSFAQAASVLLGTYLILRLGGSLAAIGWFYLAVQAILGLACLALALQRLPVAPALSPRAAGNAGFGEWDRFLRFSIGAFVGQLAWSVVYQWDRLFIGHWLPLSELTYYLIPSFLLQKTWVIPTTISAVAFPMFSELHGAKDAKAMKVMYKKCAQLLLAAVLPMFVLLAVLAPQILTLWLGSDFSVRGTWPLRILCMGYLIFFLGVVAGTAYSGAGYIREGLMTNVGLAGSCLLLWWLLIPRLGISGAAWGFLLAYALSYGPFIAHVNRRVFSLSAAGYLIEVCSGPFLAAAVPGFLLWLVRHSLYTWPSLLGAAALTALVYYAVGYRLLDDDARETVDHLAEVFWKKSAAK